ncbi:MAG TPA: hypothetical protein VLN49_10890 [Gemmatimonadaceae bacterium]|nr:hypothetical protein [Gemmatimonadaceae bacterium]
MRRCRHFALVCCLALIGCAGTTDPVRHVEVTISADREMADSTAPVYVTVVVVNRGARVVDAANPRGYCNPPFLVLDQDGLELLPPKRFCLLVLYPAVPLAPGDSLTIRDSWSGDMYDAQRGARAAPAGHYQLVARVGVEGRLLSSEPIDVIRP